MLFLLWQVVCWYRHHTLTERALSLGIPGEWQYSLTLLYYFDKPVTYFTISKNSLSWRFTNISIAFSSSRHCTCSQACISAVMPFFCVALTSARRLNNSSTTLSWQADDAIISNVIPEAPSSTFSSSPPAKAARTLSSSPSLMACLTSTEKKDEFMMMVI